MSDAAIVAGYRRALARVGIPVTVMRITGVAPNATTFSASVTAVVRDYTPDTTLVAETGYSARERGSLTQGDRMVILMAADLAAANFPLPMKKNDRITVTDPVSGAVLDVLNVVEVDPLKRSLASAIELKAAGVA